MVRIIAGVSRGRRLSTLKGRAVRPTSDRAKETLFNILGNRIQGCRFLDLFSGTGNVGLEAASRGAEAVVMVESDPAAVKVIHANCARSGLEERVRVLGQDCRRALSILSAEKEAFDLVFLDPPYGDLSAYDVLGGVAEKALLNRGGMAIAEHDRHALLPGAFGGLLRVRQKKVGDTVFSFYGGEVEG